MEDSPRHSVGTINHEDPLDEEDLPFDLLNSQEEHEQSQESSEQEQEVDAAPSLFISVDLETGSEVVGIVQLSAVAFLLDGEHLGTFNKYIDPQVESKNGAKLPLKSMPIHLKSCMLTFCVRSGLALLNSVRHLLPIMDLLSWLLGLVPVVILNGCSESLNREVKDLPCLPACCSLWIQSQS